MLVLLIIKMMVVEWLLVGHPAFFHLQDKLAKFIVIERVVHSDLREEIELDLLEELIGLVGCGLRPSAIKDVELKRDQSCWVCLMRVVGVLDNDVFSSVVFHVVVKCLQSLPALELEILLTAWVEQLSVH